MKSPWPTKKLGEICDFIFGFSFRADDFNDKGLGMPVIRTGDLNNLRNTEKFYTGPYKDEYLVESGDVLVGLSGTIISGIWRGPKALLNQRVVKLTNFRNVEKKFIGYILPLLLKKLSEELTKSAVKNVLKNHLENLEIPLPPFPIQQKIVKILDTIQDAVEIQERIIEKTKELKKSLMAELFKYGGPSFRKGRKLKKTEIGEIPEDWGVVKLGEICEILSGGNAPQELKYFENGKYPFVRVQHLDGEKPYIEKWDLVNEEAIKEYNLKLFPAETIIFPKSGASINLEKRAKLKIPSFIVNHLCALIVNQNRIIVDFVFYYLITKKLSKSSGGSTLPYLNLSKIKNLTIPLPPLPEQREIAEILQTIDKKIEIEKKKKELYEELFKTMLNKIMSQEIDINLLDY
jgi:type I restriction enzyme S subunit